MIQEVKPEAVFVQTNEKWWDTAKLLQYVDSQEEFKNYNSILDKYSNFDQISFYQSNRMGVFWFRFYTYCAMFKLHFKIPSNFTFLSPGLETKFALEEAEKVGAKKYFLGTEFDGVTWQRLYHETRMNFPHYIW